MADFSLYAALGVDDATHAEYVFHTIPGSPSIWCAPATDTNKAFENERLRLLAIDMEAAKERKGPAPELPTAEENAAGREKDKVLLSKTCCKKWGTAPYDVNGGQPDFTEANCLDFLRALPPFLFDPFRLWCINPRNFVKDSAIEALSKAAGRELGND